jgi:hypothetical protein
MREEDTRFVDDLLEAEGPRIFGIGPTRAYLDWVSHELRDRVGITKVRDQGMNLELEDGREITLRWIGPHWMRGRRIDTLIEHPAVYDHCTDDQYHMMHLALAPCLLK